MGMGCGKVSVPIEVWLEVSKLKLLWFMYHPQHPQYPGALICFFEDGFEELNKSCPGSTVAKR